jgi:hypothetical protein
MKIFSSKCAYGGERRTSKLWPRYSAAIKKLERQIHPRFLRLLLYEAEYNIIFLRDASCTSGAPCLQCIAVPCRKKNKGFIDMAMRIHAMLSKNNQGVSSNA